jgi:acetoin utilization deacetylase AcuC-like enzyme
LAVGWLQYTASLLKRKGDLHMHIFINPYQTEHAPRHDAFRVEIAPFFENESRFDFVPNEITRWGLAVNDVLTDFGISQITRVHSVRYIEFLRQAWAKWVVLDASNNDQGAFPAVWPIYGLRSDIEPRDFCAKLGLYLIGIGALLWRVTWIAAYVGAQRVLAAAKVVLRGESAFILTHPPEHHAGMDFFGGYSFLNNAAIAARYCLDGGAVRVVIIDADYHHGNRIQDVFYTRNDVSTTSLDGDPLAENPFYLGHVDEFGEADGLGLNLNQPLTAGTDMSNWFAELQTIIERVRDYRPDVLIVALGVDAAQVDSIGQFELCTDDFVRLGEVLAQLSLPALFIMEGGYAAAEIGVNLANVLVGFKSILQHTS